ncbi:MAG TPA: PEGA domain-containing protein [Methanospirillum sp.]|nr:PEGA domain-containing protein [Methanospirillum sp.]
MQAISGGGSGLLAGLLLIALIGSVSAIVSVDTGNPNLPTGTVYVDGQPAGMAISLDGHVWGNTPSSGVLEISNISVGNHTLRASQVGYQAKDLLVQVFGGQISKVRFELTTLPTGSVKIESIPVNVQVYLDDIYKGITPVTIGDVQSGTHTLVMRLSGYQDWSTLVTILPGEEVLVSGSLTRLDGGVPGVVVPTASQTKAGTLPVMIVAGLCVAMTLIRYRF